MTDINGLVHRLKRREFAVGAWVNNGDYAAARRAGDSAADFTIVDMEHLWFSFPDLGHTLQWMLNPRNEGRTKAPIVRIPPNASEHDQWITKQTLDHGAMGILTPMTMTPEDVAAAVSAMRYPAAADGSGGVRGAYPTYASRYWGTADFRDYMTRADLWPLNPDGQLTLMILVEHVEAWEAIEELVTVPGLGAVFWGPADGSTSLGNRDYDYANPTLVPYRERVVEACRNAGVAVGTPGVVDPFTAIDQGFDFIALPSAPGADLAEQLRNHYAERRA